MKPNNLISMLNKFNNFNFELFRKRINKDHSSILIDNDHFDEFVGNVIYNEFVGNVIYNNDQNIFNMFRVNEFQYNFIKTLIKDYKSIPLSYTRKDKIIFFPSESYLKQLNNLILNKVLYEILFVKGDEYCYVILVSDFVISPKHTPLKRFFGIDIFDFFYEYNSRE